MYDSLLKQVELLLCLYRLCGNSALVPLKSRRIQVLIECIYIYILTFR